MSLISTNSSQSNSSHVGRVFHSSFRGGSGRHVNSAHFNNGLQHSVDGSCLSDASGKQQNSSHNNNNNPVGHVESSSDGNDGWSCVVCCQRVPGPFRREFYAIGPCDHPVCYECSTKMRLMCRQNECPICRQEILKVCWYPLTHDHFMRCFANHTFPSDILSLMCCMSVPQKRIFASPILAWVTLVFSLLKFPFHKFSLLTLFPFLFFRMLFSLIFMLLHLFSSHSFQYSLYLFFFPVSHLHLPLFFTLSPFLWWWC